MDDELIELLGVDDDEDPLLGALRYRSPRTARGRRSARSALKQALVPKTPGVPKPGAREFILGFEPVQFTDSSALNFDLVATPQRPFKGRRLVLAIERSADGIGGLITVTRILVGQVNQLVSSEPIIADAFLQDSTHVEMALDPATPGIDIIVSVQCSVQPTTSATVDIGACCFGLSVG